MGKPADTCSAGVLVKELHQGEKEGLLYLPLYDETKSLEIGVEKSANLEALPDPFQKRILIYGSSIVNGAAASRPGMAYPARLSRNTGLNFLNLGLSGSAKMERQVADLIASIDADAYVLDCVPNSSAAIIKERTQYLVTKIREHHPTAPIIVMETIIREQSHWDNKMKMMVSDQNEAIAHEVQVLRQRGVKDLYLISSGDMLGSDHEGSVDGTHPNDLGFDRMIRVLQPQLTEILARYGITVKQPNTATKNNNKR